MASLITFEEALALGELTSHDEIGELVERAWAVRTERFGDSTDMCSLVNAKSGGCAEDCGFCAQSRYAEADTPMHAMMEPEQILEHAQAAEAAGAHRFCMVTQGQGLSKRDFEKIVEGAKLVAEHTNLKRCASVGHISRRPRPHARRGRRSSASTTTSRPPAPTTTRSPRRSATRAGSARSTRCARPGWRPASAASSTSARAPRQRVEMAFELAEIDPTSVPINLLNPRTGTKFGDRDLMDPWDVVKWIAIFRLILPDALFRLCGGRVENLARAAAAGRQGRPQRRDDGQLPDHAGRRAGRGPRDVRRARASTSPASPTTAPTRGPTTATAGSTARRRATPVDDLIDSQDEANFWDPSTQLRVIKKKGEAAAPTRSPARERRRQPARRAPA